MRQCLKILILLFILANSYNTIAQKTILWSIENESTDNKSYLLGTFHQMGNSFIDSLPIIKELLLKSDLGIFESIDNSSKLIATLNSRKDDNCYLKYLKKDDIDFLVDISKDWEVSITKLTPVELLIKLNQEYVVKNCGTVKQTDKWKHFDKYLVNIAQINNHRVLGLENDSIQTSDLNENRLNWNDAEKYINKAINNIQKTKNKRDICYNAQQYMKFITDYQFSEKCDSNSLIERNNNWLQKITPNLQNENLFIAVGLMHLYGDCGIIMQLRNKGYKVSPVFLKASP